MHTMQTTQTTQNMDILPNQTAQPNLPNKTFQTKPTKTNLPKQTYQSKPIKPNLQNQTRKANPQGKPTKPNQLCQPSLQYQTKPNLLAKVVNAWVRSAFGNVFNNSIYLIRLMGENKCGTQKHFVSRPQCGWYYATSLMLLSITFLQRTVHTVNSMSGTESNERKYCHCCCWTDDATAPSAEAKDW